MDRPGRGRGGDRRIGRRGPARRRCTDADLLLPVSSSGPRVRRPDELEPADPHSRPDIGRVRLTHAGERAPAGPPRRMGSIAVGSFTAIRAWSPPT
jgi:hypothetical protein